MSKVLIIDDEIEICKQVSLILSKNGYHVTYVTSYKELSNLLTEEFSYDLVLVDLWLKNSTKQGIDIIQYLKNNFNDLIIISFSGHANIDNAIESVKAGANDFIEKPFETKKLIHIIQKNILELKQRVTINNYRSQISFHSKINQIGFGDQFNNLLTKIERIKINSSILISGPNGIGKNYLSNKIHLKLSSNNPDTFINMNENLMNEGDLLKLSSLHNYFTIYFNDFEKFNRIDILNYVNLVKNKNINATIILDTKNFKGDDLISKSIDYFFDIKPLSLRKTEIMPLFKHYIDTFSFKKFEKKLLIDESVSNILITHPWPGNIFELMNTCENIVNLIPNNQTLITIDIVNKIMKNLINDTDLYNLNYKDAKDKFEKDFILKNLKINNWNMTVTAKILKLDRVSLYRKIKSLDIKIG